MAEVDEVIRAVISAGELILRATEFTVDRCRDLPRLVQNLASWRGGGAAQVSANKLRRKGQIRAFEVPARSLNEINRVAKEAGVKYALVDTKGEDTRVLMCSSQHATLFRDVVSFSREAPEVPEDAKDARLTDTPQNEKYFHMELDPQDAGPFFDAANDKALMYAASDAHPTAESHMAPTEMLFESLASRMEEDCPTGPFGPGYPEWDEIRPSAIEAAEITPEQFSHLKDALPARVPLGASEQDGGNVLIAYRGWDQPYITDILPDLPARSMVTSQQLRERLYSPRETPVSILVPDSEKLVAQDILKENRIVPRKPLALAAKAERVRLPLQVRMANAARSEPSQSVRQAVHTCTLPKANADIFRAAARALGLPFREAKQGSMVRFDVASQDATRASAVLAGAGLAASFAPRSHARAAAAAADMGR